MISNGIDLVSIKRFEKFIDNESFLNSIFNTEEIIYIKKHKKLDTIAGMFAAKEAMLKSIKKGINNYSLKDIEIIHDSNKAPSFIFYNELKEYNNYNISLSISHDGDYAIALVSMIIL